MQQGIMGLLALMMLGSAWEIGNSESIGGSPSLSSFSVTSSGAKRSKAAAKEMMAQIEKKAAESDDSKSKLFAAKVAENKPTKAAARVKAEPAAAVNADALKAAPAKSIDELMAEVKATGSVAKALGEMKAEKPPLAAKSAAPTTQLAAAKKAPRPMASNKAKAYVGKVLVVGSLAQKHAVRGIKKRISSIRYCYHRQLIKKPTLSGKLTARVTVKRGRVSQVQINQSTLNEKTLERCVASRMKRFRYPKSRGASVITYPLTFVP